MSRNIIAKSRSGKTYIILNEDGSMGLNSSNPFINLAQLKWITGQENFNPGFFKRVPEALFENVTPAPIDVFSLPVVNKDLVHLNMYGHSIEPYIVTTYKLGSGFFRHYSGTGDIVLSELNQKGNIPFSDWGKSNDEILAEFLKKKNIEQEKKAARRQEWLNEMNAPAKGWYVVTLEVLVSKIKGNDGKKAYSFKVLAESQMDAYNKVCELVLSKGVEDRNVSFVYDVASSARTALIEYVGVWTDEAELEYN